MKNLYTLSPAALESKLNKRVITYANAGQSTIKADGIRSFLVEEIQTDGFAELNGKRYVVAATRDLDDAGERKFRTLHVAGITKVRGRFATAVQMIKTLF
jgi:hypothetical protein